MLNLEVNSIKGLGEKERKQLQWLTTTYDNHIGANKIKNKYYEGHVTLGDVNLGIALPIGFKNLEIGCEWGAKTVDVLASRSMFDGFVGIDGTTSEAMMQIAEGNRLIPEYTKACRDELKYGCTFATLSQDDEVGCKIRFHSPETASAHWSGELNRIDYGMAIIDSQCDALTQTYIPTLINLYNDEAVWVIRFDGKYWNAEKYPHKMGQALMVPLVWNATNKKPLGRSRLKKAVRSLIDGYIRTIANATIGLEFATSPQKYLLGVSDDQYDAIVNQKFKQYIGTLLTSTTNPETGEKPSFGQLPQGNLSPHVEMVRILATQFSAATGLAVTDTGVVNEANPTSSDAILAQSQTLILMAEQLNASNGEALKLIARMAQAIATNKSLDELSEEEMEIIPHFKNPAMPSVASTADAALKIASSREGFANTDIYLEMVGFSQADIRRIKAQEQRARGASVLLEFEE